MWRSEKGSEAIVWDEVVWIVHEGKAIGVSLSELGAHEAKFIIFFTIFF